MNLKLATLLLAASALVNCAPKSSSDDLNPAFTVELTSSVDRRAGANLKVNGEFAYSTLAAFSLPERIAQPVDQNGLKVNVNTQCARIESEAFIACYRAGNNTDYVFTGGSMTNRYYRCTCDNGGVVIATDLQPGARVYGSVFELALSSGPAGKFITTSISLELKNGIR